VRRLGRVLYIVGEGGREPVQRTMHRMARAYELKLEEIQQDSDFPLTAAFGAAPIDSDQFQDELMRMLDTYQPYLKLTDIVDSPFDVELDDTCAPFADKRGVKIGVAPVSAWRSGIKLRSTQMRTTHCR
jgi:hypothetical protein